MKTKHESPTPDELIRQWKDGEGAENPAGPMEITDEELQEVHGGSRCGSFYRSGRPCHCF